MSAGRRHQYVYGRKKDALPDLFLGQSIRHNTLYHYSYFDRLQYRKSFFSNVLDIRVTDCDNQRRFNYCLFFAGTQKAQKRSITYDIPDAHIAMGKAIGK